MEKRHNSNREALFDPKRKNQKIVSLRKCPRSGNVKEGGRVPSSALGGGHPSVGEVDSPTMSRGEM